MKLSQSQIFDLYCPITILGRRSAPKLPVPTKSPVRSSFKQALFGLASAAVLAAMMPSAVLAQDNDVDAFDGTINTNCAGQTPIAATPSNGRAGNDVSGSSHCVGNYSSNNALSGQGNMLGEYAGNNLVSGENNMLSDQTYYNTVSGYGNILGEYAGGNAVSGEANVLGETTYSNAVSGVKTRLAVITPITQSAAS